MPPQDEVEEFSLWWNPALRESPPKSAELFLQDKQRDDGAEGLWRVHDSLYDLSSFVENHPGGSEWLRLTKGTDVTEAFESHHVTTAASHMLAHFYVRPATTERNSPYTFRENGFYKTIQKRAREALAGVPRGPTFSSALIADMLALSIVVFSVLAAVNCSYSVGALAGLLVALNVVTAHNFLHQKDNFRMYYFNLSFMSFRDWRVGHAMSHHLFPNSLLDLDISMFAPLFQFLPDPSKTWWGRYGPWIYSPLVYSFMFHGHMFLRLWPVVKGNIGNLHMDDAVPLVIPFSMMVCAGVGAADAFWMWMWITVTSSLFFHIIAFNGAHHHPEIFHEGDAPRADRDWGLAQLDTVRERPAVNSSLFAALTNFGYHGLHHLFPAVDHSRLPLIYPALQKTCEEFGVSFAEYSLLEMYKGQFQQIARNKPNPIPPGQVIVEKITHHT
ncbi:cytochrome b5-related protein-like isoform X2 [Periplaneta americana]